MSNQGARPQPLSRAQDSAAVTDTWNVAGGAFRFSARRAQNLAQELEALSAAVCPLDLAPNQARALVLGHEAWIFSVTDAHSTGHAFGVLERGRIHCKLGVTVSADLPGQTAFWDGLQAFRGRHGVSSCWVESIRRPAGQSVIPRLRHETHRTSNVKLYTMDLAREDALAGLSSNHKRNISKAKKNGAQLVELAPREAFRVHLDLMGLSLTRRKERGEPTHLGAKREVMEAILAAGAGTLFQAAVNGEVLSSKLVYMLGRAGYYHGGGTSPRGMELGVSHYLMHEIMRRAKESGIRTFNLDVASASAGGLGRYKEGFGPDVWEVERVQIEGENPCAAIIHALARMRRFFKIPGGS